MKYLILLCLVALVQSRKYWRPCKGNTGIVHSVEVQGCTKKPCLLKKGADTSIKMEFTTPVDIKNLGVKMQGQLGIWLPLPGGPTEGCDDKGCKCPLKAGGRYQFEKTVHVSTSFPSLHLLIAVSLMDDDGNRVACVELPAYLE